MNRSKDMKYTYKGFIGINAKENDLAYLGVLYKSEMFFVTISDHEKIYEQLKPNQTVMCLVEFQDGTEPINFIDAKNVEFEDIFIWIQDLLTVSLKDDDINVINLLMDDEEARVEFHEMYNDLLDGDDVKKMINIYKKYTKKWVETH